MYNLKFAKKIFNKLLIIKSGETCIDRTLFHNYDNNVKI
jgi:hypothetical protein